MDQDVYIITPSDEIWIGKVRDLMDGGRQDKLEISMRDILDDLVFSDENKNYAVFTIELR